jgi:hypothetical protein
MKGLINRRRTLIMVSDHCRPIMPEVLADFSLDLLPGADKPGTRKASLLLNLLPPWGAFVTA